MSSGAQRKGVAAWGRFRSVNARVSRSLPMGRAVSHSAELKDKTISTGATIAIGTTTAFSPFILNAMATGTTASTRVGRRITMKSLLVKGSFSMAPTTTGSTPVRVLIVYDKQTNGAAPVATDVVLTDEIHSPMNLSNSHRFVTLMDEVVPCFGSQGPQSAMFTRFVKLDHQVEFNTGNAGTVADIQTGSVYCLVWQNGRILIAAPTADIYTRIRFSDN